MTPETLILKKEIRILKSKRRLEPYRRLIESVRVFKKSKIGTDINCQKKFIQLWNVVKPTLEIAVFKQVSNKRLNLEIREVIYEGDNIMCNSKIDDNQVLSFIDRLSKVFSEIEKKLE